MKKKKKKTINETKQKIKDGTWFLEFIKNEMLKAKNINKLKDFRKKYKSLNKDQLALKIINHYAMKTTGLGLATGLLAGFAAAAAIIPDILAVTRMQLFMITYLTMLYSKYNEIDPDYPEPVLRIFAVVVGGWNNKAFYTNITNRRDSKGMESLRSVSKRLGKKILAKGTFTKGIPFISSAAGGSLNFIRTQRLGKFALLEFKGKKETEELFSIYGFNEIDFRKEVMLSVISLMKCDNNVSQEEIQIFDDILKELQFSKSERKELVGIMENNEPLYFLDFAQMQLEEQKTFLIHTLIRTALSDGTYTKSEKKYIKKVCKILKIPYKNKLIEDYKETSEFHEQLRDFSLYSQALDSP